MRPTGLTPTPNKQIKSSQNQGLSCTPHCKRCCPFYSLTFTHAQLETYGFVYSPARHELGFIPSAPLYIWTPLLLMPSLTHHFGDVNLDFCCPSLPLMAFRAHLTEQNQRQPCCCGHSPAQLCYFQHPVAQNLCNDKMNLYICIFVDTHPTLQFKEMQTQLRCRWLWLMALKWCDCIPARHGWNTSLTGGRQLCTH